MRNLSLFNIISTICLFQLSAQVLAEPEQIKKYAIELMWINDQLDLSSHFIQNGKDSKQTRRELFTPALKWAKSNPDADVRIWYDGNQTTKTAISATEELLQRAMRDLSVSNVRLRDLQEIPIVKVNQDAFSSQVPVYLRIDIFKVVLIVYSVSEEGNDAAIFADRDIGEGRPSRDQMPKDELFDRANLEQLDKWGFVTGCDGRKPENKFLQLVKNSEMIQSLKHVVINANLLRIVTILNREPGLRLSFNHFVDACGDTITNSYHFYAREEKVLCVRPDIIGLGTENDPWVDYDPKTHGYRPFGDLRSTSGKYIISMKEGFELPRRVTNFAYSSTDLPSGYCRKGMFGHDGGHHGVPDEVLKRVVPPADGESYKAAYWN